MSNNIPGSQYPNVTNAATASNPYQTNIGRSKTKKWVTAPTQNYDGDDWGNDFDDEPAEPMPALPGPATGRHAMKQAITPPPGMHSSLPSAGARNMSGPPSLHLQTQQPTGAPSPGTLPSDDRRSFTTGGMGGPAVDAIQSPVFRSAPTVQSPSSLSNLPSRQETTSSPVASPSSLTSGSKGARVMDKTFPPRESSLSTQDGPPDLTVGPRSQDGIGSEPDSRPAYGHVKPWMEPRSASPQGPRSPPGGTKQTSFIRPSDIYRRMKEERQRQPPDSSSPSVESVTNKPGNVERAESPVVKSPINISDAHEQPRGLSPPGENTPATSPSTVKAAGLATVAEHKSDDVLNSLDSGSASKPLQLNFDYSEEQVAKHETATVKTALLPTNTMSENAARPVESPNPTATLSQGSDQLHAQKSSPSATKMGESHVGGTKEPQTSAAATVKESASVSTGDKGTMLSSSGQDAKSYALTDATSDEEDDNELRRYSSSPKLPDFARMSSFGLDFLSTSSAVKGEDQPPVPMISTEHQAAPKSGGNKVTAEEISKPEALGEDKKARKSEVEQQRPQELGLIDDGGKKEAMKPPEEEGAISRVSPVLSSSPTPGTNDAKAHNALGLGLPVNNQQAAAELARKVSQRKPVPAPKIEPVARTGTMDTTATFSSVKESDKLTDEIIKSLSPQVAASDPLAALKLPGDSVPRESAYLGDVYDYYGSFDEKAADEEEEEAVPHEKPDSRPSSSPKGKLLSATPNLDDEMPKGSMSPKPLNTHKKQPSVEIPTKLRHKFSWEAAAEEVSSPSNVVSPNLIIPPDSKASPDADPKSLSLIVPPSQLQPPLLSSPISPAPENSAISPISSGSPNLEGLVSQSSMLPTGTQPAPFELPSPLSALSETKNTSQSEEQKTPKLAEEKAIITTATSPVEAEHPALSPTATTEESRDDQQPTTPIQSAPGLASLSLQQQTPDSPTAKIWTFREIMALPTSEERIQRMIETRQVFAKLDSGLGPWLGTMTASPEHANASSLLREDVNSFVAGPIDNQSGAGAAPHLAHPQPYYQQYVNASNTNLASSGAGEPTGRPLSGAPNLSQLTSEFRHSGGQVGAKGKEFFKSAGKAGKGLFSKGKSKLQTAREEWR